MSRNCDCHASITQIKIDISIQLLETCRSIAVLCLLQKCINSATPSPLPLEARILLSARLHNQFSFKQIFGKTRSFNSSALPRAISLWNDLPNAIACLSNRDAFHERLTSHVA